MQLCLTKKREAGKDWHQDSAPASILDDAIDALGEQHGQEGQTTVKVQVGHHGIKGDTDVDKRQ